MKLFTKAISVLGILCLAVPAQAYIGPGAGISVVGSLLGLLGTVLLAVAVIFLWPFRRLLKRGRDEDTETVDTPETAETAADMASNVAAAERSGDK